MILVVKPLSSKARLCGDGDNKLNNINITNALLVDYQYYTLKTVEKWQNRFCVDTKNVRFNVFNFWLHQNHIDMDWMGAFEPTP